MKPSRRDFLKSAAGTTALASLPPAAAALLQSAARAASDSPKRDTVLVVLQLSGGNDGLNTVVPHADDAYGRARKTLRLTAKQVHKIDDYLGFHPEMAGFSRLFREGRLSVIQGVGYPKSDRSHPGAMRNWHTGRPDDAQCPTGWLGRVIDSLASRDDPGVPGIFVAPVPKQFALNTRQAVVPAIRTAGDSMLRAGPGSQTSRQREQTLAAAARPQRTGGTNALLNVVRGSTLAACTANQRVASVVSGPAGTDKYPPYQLAGSLRSIAQLIRADLGIRVFFTELGGGGIGGFDNHASQRDNHAALLKQLSESLAAFADDLARDKQLERVALMTFSEFGRTLSENGRRGTGHGAAQPVFVVGGRLKGGLVGKHPSLTDLDQDAPKHHTDFRRVYATMLDTWLGIDSHEPLGGHYPPVDVFQV